MNSELKRKAKKKKKKKKKKNDFEKPWKMLENIKISNL